MKSEPTFNPKTIRSFIFEAGNLSQSDLGYCLNLNYAFDEQYSFCEKIIFPKVNAIANLALEQLQAINHCLPYLQLMVGISYYKAALPNIIKIENFNISKKVADFFNKVYLLGLGEFAYKNQQKLVINFPFSSDVKEQALKLDLKSRVLLPLGGGKDSLLSLDFIKSIDTEFSTITVGNYELIDQQVETLELKHIKIKRIIDPLLFDLNNQGAYNGHVPITAINSFICLIAAIIYDYDKIYFSNENSANFSNLKYNNLEINHQYSKSLEFENDFRELLKNNLISNIEYCSLIRPLCEFAICQKFAKLPKYHKIFSSCNSNFAILKKNKQLWCGTCPKCAFVFLMLACSLEPSELITIFGQNLLENLSLIKLFEELCEFKGFKPFECVGTVEESCAAVKILSVNKNWMNTEVVSYLVKNYKNELANYSSKISDYCQLGEEHNLNKNLFEQLSEYVKH